MPILTFFWIWAYFTRQISFPGFQYQIQLPIWRQRPVLYQLLPRRGSFQAGCRCYTEPAFNPREQHSPDQYKSESERSEPWSEPTIWVFSLLQQSVGEWPFFFGHFIPVRVFKRNLRLYPVTGPGVRHPFQSWYGTGHQQRQAKITADRKHP